MNIDLILKKIQEEKNEITPFFQKINISSDNFAKIFVAIAEKNIKKRNFGIEKKYIFDNENKKILNELFYYITKDKRFTGDFSKGIMIAGKVGNGKTLIMQSFAELLQKISIKRFVFISSIELVNELKTDYSKFVKTTMFIDDLGKETTKINNYGTVENPIVNLFQLRYNANSMTFATSNYTFESLEKLYTKAVIDRFVEMFNVFTLNGNSKRK